MLFSFISGPAKHFTKLSLVGARNKTISKMLQDNNRSRIRKMSSEGHNGDCCSATVSRRAQLHVLLRNCALRNRAQLLQHFPLHRQRRSSFSLFSYSNAREYCALVIEFFFPHDRFLQGKNLQHSPLSPAPPPNKTKYPWKGLYTSQYPLLYVNTGQSL